MALSNPSTAPRHELLQVADAVAREKNIDREIVIEAMELAIQKAGRSKYGHERDIRAKIDRKTGEIRLDRYRHVVENVEDSAIEITLEDAKVQNPEIELDGYIIDPLPPIDFGRIAAQTAKQVIVQRVREAEREKQYEEYKDRIGDVINGVVKRLDFGNVVVDLGRTEAILSRNELIPRETFQNGDRIRAYIFDVRREQRGPQIFLSRTRPEFMAKLFAQEVPEIYDGLIEIKSVARDPGSRAKIAVYTKEHSLDPVGACVGMRGSRVQSVVSELQGEKIDIVLWSEDIVSFVVNALSPAEISKVVMNEETNHLEVVVPDKDLSTAIGRRGQNIKLCSMLTGCNIDILTEEEESEKRQEEFKTRSKVFMEELDVDDVIAHLLITEGFSSIEEVAFVDKSDLENIEGFDPDIAQELQSRATVALEKKQAELNEKLEKLGLEEDLVNAENLTLEMAIKLGEKGIKKLDELADLSADELGEILEDLKLSNDELNEIIMSARAHWFTDDETEQTNDDQKESD